MTARKPSQRARQPMDAIGWVLIILSVALAAFFAVMVAAFIHDAITGTVGLSEPGERVISSIAGGIIATVNLAVGAYFGRAAGSGPPSTEVPE